MKTYLRMPAAAVVIGTFRVNIIFFLLYLLVWTNIFVAYDVNSATSALESKVVW